MAATSSASDPDPAATPELTSPADEQRLTAALEHDVRAMLAALAGSAVEEARLERGGVRIAMRRALVPSAEGEPPPAASAVRAEPGTEPPAEPGRTDVLAQWVGVFHRARQLDGPLLASEGERVESGQPLGVIETLGIANDVESPAGGVLSRFVVQDGQAVEYGELLAIVLEE